MSTMPTTPELDKQSEIIRSGKAELVQEFYDWLMENGFFYGPEVAHERTGCRYQTFYPGGPEQVMADFFGIDRDKIETERRALLEALQERGESLEADLDHEEDGD